MIRKDFSRAASGKESWRREGLPDPSKVAARGITTKESLAWLSARSPGTPEPAPSLDDPALQAAAIAAAQEARRAQIAGLRAEFKNRPQKAKRDFGTARDYRGSERER